MVRVGSVKKIRMMQFGILIFILCMFCCGCKTKKEQPQTEPEQGMQATEQEEPKSDDFEEVFSESDVSEKQTEEKKESNDKINNKTDDKTTQSETVREKPSPEGNKEDAKKDFDIEEDSKSNYGDVTWN